MELFTVTRYNEETNEKADNKSEDVILENLLQKVEKRKRKRKALEEERENAEENINNRFESKKKQTKQETEAEIAGEHTRSSLGDVKESTETAAYEILGEDVQQRNKQIKIDTVLPPWLANPTIVSTTLKDERSSDSDFSVNNEYLAPHIRHSLKELNITELFPVQAKVIPYLLEAHSKPPPFRPRDICVSAPTGSGKTLAFAIPVVQLLTNRTQKRIRALVVLPVIELAVQVYKVFKKLCEKTDLRTCLLSTQVPFANEQDSLIDYHQGGCFSKVDIVITTPGRLVDHIHATKGFDLSALKFLIIDEADRIMDAVFQNWLYHLDSHVRTTSEQLLSGRVAPLCYNELLLSSPTQPQKLLFSATLSQDPEKLQNMGLFQPKLFTSVATYAERLAEPKANEKNNASDPVDNNVARGDFLGKYSLPTELTATYCITESRLKPLTLYTLIKEKQWRKFLCFTNSAESSTRLTFVLSRLLKSDLNVTCLSATMTAPHRAKILQNFMRGKINGLICTDALARGIDVEVDIVISYDPPRHIKTYIHRIGRTARAGRPGTAVMLLTQPEHTTFNKILSEVGEQLTNELHVSTNMEEENAVRYSEVLKQLRQQVERDQSKKVALKTQSKEKALASLEPKAEISEEINTKPMTLNEKFRKQVAEFVDNQNTGSSKKIGNQQKKSKKQRFKKTKKPKEKPSSK